MGIDTDVFISYRRSDSGLVSELIYQELERKLSKNNIRIFLDKERDLNRSDLIHLGDNWANKIKRALNSSKVVLVVMGQEWLAAKDENHRRRIDNPEDWVHWEVKEAINGAEQNKKRLITLLIDEAEMPKDPEAFPSEIVKISKFQAIKIRSDFIDSDLEEVAKEICSEVVGKRYDEKVFLNSLEKYDILDLEPIGEGNLARIYQARDKDMNRLVSIKLLRHQSKKLIIAFDQSVKRAIKISDEPHFLTIYDLHLKDSPYHYYVRQFVEGQDLRKYIEEWTKDNETGLPLKEVRKIILDIGEALCQAHKRIRNSYRYKYTDIKPSNVLLSDNFETFISSFNICDGFERKKIVEELKRMSTESENRLLYQEHLSYLLPDHFYTGDTSYEKTDQYMLGLLAYELLTGRMPPTLDNIEELDTKKYKAFNRIDSIPRSDCPEIFKTVILRMISINPEDRYERFDKAVDFLKNLDINLTIAKDSYLRCINSPKFSDEKFFIVFRDKLKNLSQQAYDRLNFKSKKDMVSHANSLKQSILFLFAYYEQDERFYKNTDKTEEPNILTGITKTHQGIPKHLYEPFGKALIETIAEFDTKFEDYDILQSVWQNVYNSAVKYMTSKLN